MNETVYEENRESSDLLVLAAAASHWSGIISRGCCSCQGRSVLRSCSSRSRGTLDSLERLVNAAAAAAAASTPPPENEQCLRLYQPMSQRRRPVLTGLLGAVGRRSKYMSGQFCLAGDTMEGIVQCLVFLKAFSVRKSH
ncbi:hypothetical protein B566_EDAN010817 [Ephemera danica]|nr:hypothetical protein B566_EDAN010817 [Ephemera danica]